MTSAWCEHLGITSKYTILKYRFDGREVVLKVQTWVCPECGVHGADTEIVTPQEADCARAVG
ncbi:MAG: hypothetical protein P4N41_07990 [Negativicutes bacterium]|nr:hypothetical protein [Negativicutes bacterium]